MGAALFPRLLSRSFIRVYARGHSSPVRLGGVTASGERPLRLVLGRRPTRHAPVPSGALPSGHSRDVLVRCLGKGDLRWLWHQIPRTYSRRARAANRRPPHRPPRRVGRCCLRGCQSLPLLQRSPTDERERTRTGTAPAGPGVGTQAPARTSRPTQPGRDCRSGRGRPWCRVLGAVRARKSHGNELRQDAGCASGLRAAPRPASARCRAEPAAGALLVRDAPRGHRDRLAGTTAYALEATVVLDNHPRRRAMRRAVLVAGSSKGLRHAVRHWWSSSRHGQPAL